MRKIRVPILAGLVGAACLLAGGGVAAGYLLASRAAPKPELAGMYLDLTKRALTDLLYETDPNIVYQRLIGKDWPSRAVTMVGIKRLDNIQACAEDVLRNDIPGDFLEAGAWRGGATMFMQTILKAYGDNTRTVWVADSFEGVPPSNPAKYPADTGWNLDGHKVLAVSLEEVQANFKRFGLLDERVKFLKGWFKDTLAKAPIGKLAVLRLDGDLYESTMDTLIPLYPKLSPGGYCIIDDYFAINAQRAAVDKYRHDNGITEQLHQVDWAAAYWQKGK
jgi:O-methyltransferase